MSLLNAIKAFVNPPSDSDVATQQAADDNTDGEIQTPSQINTTGGSKEDNVPDTVTEDDALELEDNEDKKPATAGTSDSSVQPKAEIEGESWPYMIKPTESVKISDKEIIQKGHPIESGEVKDDGSEEFYMGEWPRLMIESRHLEEEPETWIGYQDDPVKKVDPGGIGYKYLFRHSAIFGETGQGKTTLLQNMMLQWINAGYGTCFIDPKGAEDSKGLVQRIPKHRLDDVIWIEPGSKRDKMIGFNLLETDADPGDEDFQSEVKEVVTQFAQVIKNTEDSGGAIINEVTEEVTRHLVKQEYDYNVLDLYTILFNEEQRSKLPDMETDSFGKQALQQVADKKEDELASIKRRVRPWVTDVTTREILDVRDTGVNLTKAIEDGKILIVKTDQIPGESVEQMFVTAMVRRIWSTIKRRDVEEKDYDPYFLVVDEFDNVAVDRLGIGEILGEARAYNFSITLATQQPSSLSKDVQQDVFKNSKNVFTFSPGNYEDARTLANEFGEDLEPSELTNLGEYRIAGRIMADGKPHTVILDAFPPYPPLWTLDEAEEFISLSLDRYGKPTEQKEWTEEVMKNYGIQEEYNEDNEEAEETFDIGGTVSLTLSELLRAVFTAQVKKPTRKFNGKDGYIDKDSLREILEDRYGEVQEIALDRVAKEKIPDNLLDTEMDGGIYFRLSEEGEAKAFEQDTGEGGSGGKAKHRHVLSKAWKEFTRLGYDMDLPNQDQWEGTDPPDGIAIPPIKPTEDSTNSDEFSELMSIFQRDYPRIWGLFKDYEVAIEAETTTPDKPKQTIKNLAKAYNRNQKCALVVNEKSDGKYEENPYEDATPTEVLEKKAKKVYNIFKSPAFVSDMDKDGNRKFYNMNSDKNIQLQGQDVALQKKSDSRTIWREDGNKVVLENGNESDQISFRDPTKIHNNPSRTKFNYYYRKDKSSDLIVVKNSKNEVVEEYDTVTQMKNDGWTNVTPPVIPETLWDETPTEDDWVILATPRATNPEYDSNKLYVYNPDAETEDGKFEPLVPEDKADAGEGGGFEVSKPTIGNDADEEDDEAEPEETEPSRPTISKPTVGGDTEETEEETSTPTSTTESTENSDEKPSVGTSGDVDDAFADYRDDGNDASETDEENSDMIDNETEDTTPTEDEEAEESDEKPTTSDNTKPNETKPTEEKENKDTQSQKLTETESSKPTESSSNEEASEQKPSENNKSHTEQLMDDENEDEEEVDDESNDDDEEIGEDADEEVWGDYKSMDVDI